MIIEFAVIKLIFLTLAGYFNGTMDLIDEGRLAYKGYYWTRAAKEARKDYNNDGKMSFLEGAFSRDAWHWQKKYFILSMCAAGCATVFYWNFKWYWLFADVAASFVIFGAAFEFRRQSVVYKWF